MSRIKVQEANESEQKLESWYAFEDMTGSLLRQAGDFPTPLVLWF